MVGYSAFRLYDNECNLLCEKYSYIEYYQLSDGSYIGIGKIDYPEHQSPLICRDENGEILPGGLWFVDENGNETETGSMFMKKAYFFSTNQVEKIQPIKRVSAAEMIGRPQTIQINRKKRKTQTTKSRV